MAATLTQRAEALLAYAKQLDASLAAHQLPAPSFDSYELDGLPLADQAARDQLVDLLGEFRSLVRGPVMSMTDVIFSWADMLALRVVYHYKLAAVVPLDGSSSYKELATASGLPVNEVQRYVRVAMGIYVFSEDMGGRVRHTATSRLLATDEGFQDMLGLHLDELSPAAPYVLKAWDKWGVDSGEPQHTGFALAQGTGGSFFQVLARSPERARRFGGAMRFWTADATWHLRHVLAAYDWAAVDRQGACVVDVGGGVGQVSLYLAAHTKHLRFVVQDQQHVIRQAEAESQSLLPEHRSRVSFVAHDFFTAQPPEPVPDIFLLRWILHDWADPYAARILTNLVPAMRLGTKILIFEYVLPDHPITNTTARFGCQLDMVLAAGFNGRERTPAQFEARLADADPRFVLETVRKPEDSAMSMIEVSWKGQK